MNKRSQEPSTSSHEVKKASTGRHPRRVARRTGMACLPAPGGRGVRRLRWHQGPLNATAAMPASSMSAANEILGGSGGSASAQGDEEMLQMLLDMVEQVMHDLPSGGRIPGLPMDETSAPEPDECTPRSQRMRRVESILRSLAHMLLATV